MRALKLLSSFLISKQLHVTTQAREGIETGHRSHDRRENRVTTQAREGIETQRKLHTLAYHLRNNSSP